MFKFINITIVSVMSSLIFNQIIRMIRGMPFMSLKSALLQWAICDVAW